MNDAILLSRCQLGDECALEILFERFESPIFHFLLGVLRDHHSAEDALQETFVKALLHSDSVDRDHFRAWLFTIAYREAMLIKRKQKHQYESSEQIFTIMDKEPSGPEMADRQEQAQQVRALLDQLPGQQRDVIRARIFEGKRYREIAADLGCPLNTALARMHDGLKKLRQLWEQNHV